MRAQNVFFRERWSRSFAKAVTYRIAIMLLDFAAIYLFTGKADVAVGFMAASNVYTTVAYYGHERAWDAISWGKEKAK